MPAARDEPLPLLSVPVPQRFVLVPEQRVPLVQFAIDLFQLGFRHGHILVLLALTLFLFLSIADAHAR